jgi:hypothetical protein
MTSKRTARFRANSPFTVMVTDDDPTRVLVTIKTRTTVYTLAGDSRYVTIRAQRGWFHLSTSKMVRHGMLLPRGVEHTFWSALTR